MSLKMAIHVLGRQVAAIDGIPFAAGITVRGAMEVSYNEPALPTYDFAVEYFGHDLGYAVTTLDGIHQQAGSDPETYLFWELSVNGELSEVGIDGGPHRGALGALK